MFLVLAATPVLTTLAMSLPIAWQSTCRPMKGARDEAAGQGFHLYENLADKRGSSQSSFSFYFDLRGT